MGKEVGLMKTGDWGGAGGAASLHADQSLGFLGLDQAAPGAGADRTGAVHHVLSGHPGRYRALSTSSSSSSSSSSSFYPSATT